MYKERLLTPGPTQIPLRVLQAMERPQLHHRSDVFKRELLKACEGMRWVCGWENDPIFLACSGTGALEAAVLNSCKAGDRIISINAGAFGARWKAIGERLGLTVHELALNWGEVASVDAVTELVTKHRNARAFCIQHSETSTTVLHPVRAILEQVKAIAPDMLTVVDGISSCLTTPMPGDSGLIDMYIAGSQKAFMLPPGLAMIMISNRGWQAIEETPRRSLYFDLLLERKSLKSGETSWTPASTIIVGLNAAIEILREEGLEAVYARHELLSRINRAGLSALGFSLLAEDAPCPSVTGFKPPTGLDADTLRTEIRKRYGVRLAGGQGVLKGGIIRVGHMGNIDPFDAVNGLLAIGLTARALGARIDPRLGVDAALGLLDCSA